MIKQVTPLQVRSDRAGSGHYGAPRGSRKHRGIDYECVPGFPVLSPVFGFVSKHGQCYRDDAEWKYIEITDENGLKHRLFYVQPSLPVSSSVSEGDWIGMAQDISDRYPGQGMTPHVHYEIKQGDQYLNPDEVG